MKGKLRRILDKFAGLARPRPVKTVHQAAVQSKESREMTTKGHASKKPQKKPTAPKAKPGRGAARGKPAARTGAHKATKPAARTARHAHTERAAKAARPEKAKKLRAAEPEKKAAEAAAPAKAAPATKELRAKAAPAK
ncbi:MAG TPA: RNA polymerase sigma factor RpoD, partial [Anaeromyxobacteraceae bacterium]|nr:RNA polymerase sigma factor RpoD [Anaeromyxobacteraceae bacterium]